MSFPHEQASFLEQVSSALCRRGLRLPALIFLEAGKPMTFIGGQLLWMAQPALALFLPTSQVQQLARLLEDPAAVEALIRRLEASEI